jgi:gas vesicle protein
MADRNGGGEFFTGLVIGGLVGAAVALLLAPQSGEETRAQIRDTSLDLKDRAGETVGGAREKAEAIIADARRRAEVITADARKRAEEVTAEARKRAEEIVTEARKKAEEVQAAIPAGSKSGKGTGEA